MNIIIKKNETKKNSYLQSEMNSFTSKMSSILGSYEYFSNSVVDRKDPAFLKIIVTTQASQKLEISSFYTRLRREEEGDLRGVARTHGKDYSSPLL